MNALLENTLNQYPALMPASTPVVERKSALDHAKEQLEAGRVTSALDELFEDLSARRREEPESWAAYARTCAEHPVCQLLHQDPFIYRAFAKPRGYAGDAVMMDYIYGLGEAREAARDATPLGRVILRYMDSRPSAKAVRYRRRLLARIIDETASREGASVLAVAAGHLREVELSNAVREGKLRDFVAFDQDEASMALVAQEYGHLGVRTVPGSVRHILAKKAKLGQYDFVYAAGLYDYLSAPVAAALTRRLFEMTRPGGLMLIPNFLTDVQDSGYMEAFADWHLIYRDHADMRALVEALPQSAVAAYRIFNDDDDAIAFLLVRKAS